MTIKLSQQQAEALSHLFNKVIIPEPVANIAESLIKDLIIQVYKKLWNKLYAKKKDGYSLSLTDVEAKAFYVYFQSRNLGPDWVYEQLMIEKHLAELDRAYA